MTPATVHVLGIYELISIELVVSDPNSIYACAQARLEILGILASWHRGGDNSPPDKLNIDLIVFGPCSCVPWNIKASANLAL